MCVELEGFCVVFDGHYSKRAMCTSAVNDGMYRWCLEVRCCMCVSVLQAAAAALVQGQVPHSWDALWEGPASPLDYMRSAVRR